LTNRACHPREQDGGQRGDTGGRIGAHTHGS
jgi:hypothetical protein